MKTRASQARWYADRSTEVHVLVGNHSPICHVVFAALSVRCATLVPVGSDPLVDGVTRVLTVPLRELYALLWRAGVLEIVESADSLLPPQPRLRRDSMAALGASTAMAVAVAAAAMS